MVTLGVSSNILVQPYGAYNVMRLYFANASNNGTLDKIYVQVSGNWATSEYAKGAIYVSSTKSLVSVTSAFAGSADDNSNDKEWLSSSFGASSISSGEDYAIVVWGDSNEKHMWADNQSGGGPGYLYSDANKKYLDSGSGDYSTYFNPLDWSGFNDRLGTGRYLQMFATYDITQIHTSGISFLGDGTLEIYGDGQLKFLWK